MWRIRYLISTLRDDEGIGVVEIILILVVLIGLVIIFKSQLTSLVTLRFNCSLQVGGCLLGYR